jgi:Protein of unknown function (DUF3102)
MPISPFLREKTFDAVGVQEISVKLPASNTSSTIDTRKPRPLDVIASELNLVLKRETADIIKMGGLLVEAKGQLSHGQWLPWLAKHFPLSKSTVANYVNAYKFAIKFPIVGNLNIHPSALYMLASWVFDAKTTAAILKTAETQLVDSATACRLRSQIASSEPRCRLASKGKLNRPTELRPAPSSNSPEVVSLRRDTYLREKFAAAVLELEKLKTKPSTKFVGIIPADRLWMVCNFLNEVAVGSCGSNKC